MKGLRIGFIVLAAAVFTFGLSGMAFAFHSGGVAECMGCHNIHDAASTNGLLQASDASSTCTNDCHGNAGAGSYHIVSLDAGPGVTPRQMTPGGDFGWLLKTFTYDNRGLVTELGERHGHNVVMADRPGFVADDNNDIAPGGTMDATTFSCTSCHDQHGKLRRLSTGAFAITGAPIISSGSYTNNADPAAGQAVGAYRLLRGPGSTGNPTGVTFTTVFNAVAPSTYNRSETFSQTKVAYGQGTSEWCGSCHGDMLDATSPKHTHPVSAVLSGGSDIFTNYNTYTGSGLTGTSGYDSLVPFQLANGTTYAQMRTFATGGAATPATGSDRVTCLSCHRAHASGFEYMLRWNGTGNEFIAVDGVWPGTDSSSSIATAAKYSQGRTVAETTRAYNDKPMSYASYQRSLCNKCHVKD